MVSHFAVKLELNKGANKMAIFGKGGYDSPENKKRREAKKEVEYKEIRQAEKNVDAYKERMKDRAKKRTPAEKSYGESIKKFVTKEVPETAKNVKKAFRRAMFKTPAEKKEDKETKKAFKEQMQRNRLKDNKEFQKKNKARKAGAPDNKAKSYVYDAVRRDAQKKIKPRSLKSTLSDKKVAKVMTDQVDAMKKQAAKRGAKETKEEGIGNFKAGGPIMDRNYLKGR